MTGLGPIGTMVSEAGGRSHPWAAIEEGHRVNLFLAGAAVALYQVSLIMTHRDGFPRFSARSAWCGDAGHRKPWGTPSESLGKPSL